MEGRLNEVSNLFEILVEGNWVWLTTGNWPKVKTQLSVDFVLDLYEKADKIFKEKAFEELKRRWDLIKHTFDLRVLWEKFLIAARPFSDFALNEIFERSGKLYLLSRRKNR